MSNITEGTRVRIVKGPKGTSRPAPAYIGKVATVVRAHPDFNHLRFDHIDDGGREYHTTDHGGTWHDDVLEVINDHRPTILLEHETSREYARAADSRVLDAHHRAILTRAADGEAVDAYKFNEALVAAMSSAATRKGQSMARRELTKKIRHLAHKTQAVLENHADNLPAYETGERSRLVQELRGEISTLTLAASAERRRLCREIDDHRAIGLEQERRIADLEDRARGFAQVADRKNTVLEYALSLLSVTDRARVEGYSDRVSEEG